jgi:hypothetical protein
MISKKGQNAPVAGIIFIVLIAAFAIFLLIVGYIGNLLGTEMQEKMGITQEINDSFQTTITISTTTINTLWYILFAGLLIGLIVQAVLAQQYPRVMLPIFILTLIISIIISIVLSNTYNEITKDVTFASTSIYQQGIHFIMNNLPYLALIVGLVAIVIIFTRDGSIGGGGGIVN